MSEIKKVINSGDHLLEELALVNGQAEANIAAMKALMESLRKEHGFRIIPRHGKHETFEDHTCSTLASKYIRTKERLYECQTELSEFRELKENYAKLLECMSEKDKIILMLRKRLHKPEV